MNQHKLEKQLNEIQEHLQKKVVDQKEILNLHEAALFLCISKSTLYKMTHKRSIPFHKPAGKLILFKRQELMAWVDGKDSCMSNQLLAKKKEVINGN